MNQLEEGRELALDFEKLGKVAATGQSVLPVVLQNAETGDVEWRKTLSGRPTTSIVADGARIYVGTSDEMVMALPPAYLEKVVEGLEGLYKRGIRYPISHFGAQVDPSPGLLGAYGNPPE